MSQFVSVSQAQLDGLVQPWLSHRQIQRYYLSSAVSRTYARQILGDVLDEPF